jgi:nitronate monooxygenase
MSLWAGQTYPAAIEAPAADVVARLHADARAALAAATARIGPAGS